MSERSGPWAHHGDGFYEAWSDLRGLTPALAAQARRADVEARREALRRQAEIDERVEGRMNLLMNVAMRRAMLAGERFDPSNWQRHLPTIEQQAAELFHAQDREAAAAERKALVDAGLLHVLSVDPRDVTVLEPADEVEDRAVRTELLHARRRSFVESVRAKARRALAHTGRPRA